MSMATSPESIFFCIFRTKRMCNFSGFLKSVIGQNSRVSAYNCVSYWLRFFMAGWQFEAANPATDASDIDSSSVGARTLGHQRLLLTPPSSQFPVVGPTPRVTWGLTEVRQIVLLGCHVPARHGVVADWLYRLLSAIEQGPIRRNAGTLPLFLSWSPLSRILLVSIHLRGFASKISERAVALIRL